MPGLEEEFREIYPNADVQHCIGHKVRTTFPRIRVADNTEILDDLKQIYNAVDVACAIFDGFKGRWRKQTPKDVKFLGRATATLLTFYNYLVLSRPVVYTTIPIEPINKSSGNVSNLRTHLPILELM